MARDMKHYTLSSFGVSRGGALRVLTGVSVALLAGTMLYGVWDYLIHRPEFLVYPSTFQLATPPWASDKLAQEIQKVPGLGECYSIFERGLTRRIARAYESSPWVYEVRQIKREFPNKIDMTLVIRKPVAVVRKGHKYYLADEDGVRLPQDYYLWPHPAIKLPMLFQDRLKELPEPGKSWQDRGVRAGVLLAKFLGENGILDKLKITTIDATNVGQRRRRGDSCLVLLNEDHTRILWGCSPLCAQPGELPDREKLASLLTVAEVEKYDFSKLEYIDVRWERPAARRRQVAKVTAGTGPSP